MTKPIVGVGTEFDISGHKARVTYITRDGVACQIGKDRKFVVPFDQVETAVEKAEKESVKVVEKPKKTTKKPARKKSTKKKANADTTEDPRASE